MAESTSELLGSSSFITPRGMQTHQNVRPSTAFCLVPMKDFIVNDENIGLDCHLSPTQVIVCWLSGDPDEICLVPLHYHCVPLAPPALPLSTVVHSSPSARQFILEEAQKFISLGFSLSALGSICRALSFVTAAIQVAVSLMLTIMASYY